MRHGDDDETNKAQNLSHSVINLVCKELRNRRGQHKQLRRNTIVEIVAWCRSSCKGVCPNPAAMTPVLDTRPEGAVQEGGGQKHRKAPILPCVIFFCLFSQCSTIPCQSLVGHLRS